MDPQTKQSNTVPGKPGIGRELIDMLSKPGIAPALLGAGVGAGAGALATGSRAGENPRQRALRTIRNAAGAGLLGGAGFQMAAAAGQAGKELVTPPEGEKGFFHSTIGRLLAPAALNATGHIRSDARAGKTLKTLFGGMGEYNVNSSPPKVDLKNPESIKSFLTGHGVHADDINKVLGDPNREKAFDQLLKGRGFRKEEIGDLFKSKNLTVGFNGASEFSDLDGRFKDISKQFREMRGSGTLKWDDFVNGLVSDPRFRGNADEARRFMNLNYGNRWQDKVTRTIFPRASNFHKPWLRRLSGASGVAGMGAMVAMPEMVDWAKQQAGESAGGYAAGGFSAFGSNKGGEQ